MTGRAVHDAPAADLAELLRHTAGQRPDKTALLETSGRRMSWAELDREVDLLASGLGAAGVVAGHRVMLVLGNRIELVATYLAILRVQAVAVPVNPGSTADELARMTTDSGARMVLADADTVLACRAAGLLHEARVRLVVVGATLQPGERSYDQLRIDRGRALPPLQDPEKLAGLLYTSGTSGRPRAAMLTHRALLANLRQLAAVQPPMITTDDVVLGVLPLFHVYGLNAVLGSVLWHGATLVLVPRFDPQATLDLVGEQGCTVVPIAPPVLTHWLRADSLAVKLDPVRVVLSGSAPLPTELAAEFASVAGVEVHQGYGLTEAAPVVTSTLCSAGSTDGTGSAGSAGGAGGAATKPGSVGAALPGVELRLVDEHGDPPTGDDPGEVWVRGENLFSGYWPDGAGGPDPDGWWATGDVGFLDADGDLFLVDRLRELVIVSGFNVYPVEVEDVVHEVAGVAGVAVIGAADPDTGEAVVAYVVPLPDGPSVESLERAVREHCAIRLARFKRPTRIEVVPRLPVGVTGKVQKGRLRGLERRRRTGLLE